MSKPWPPPPDLASLQELVRNADPEGYLADGAPQDEYDQEEQRLYQAIRDRATADLTVPTLEPIFEQVWQQSAHLTAEQLANCRPALLSLAKEIARFFGPEARPRTREQILKDAE